MALEQSGWLAARFTLKKILELNEDWKKKKPMAIWQQNEASTRTIQYEYMRASAYYDCMPVVSGAGSSSWLPYTIYMAIGMAACHAFRVFGNLATAPYSGEKEKSETEDSVVEKTEQK